MVDMHRQLNNTKSKQVATLSQTVENEQTEWRTVQRLNKMNPRSIQQGITQVGSVLNQLQPEKWIWIPVIEDNDNLDEILVQIETKLAQIFHQQPFESDQVRVATQAVFKSITDGLIESQLNKRRGIFSPTQK